MKVVLQRVNYAQYNYKGSDRSIKHGLIAYVGILKNDTAETVEYVQRKILTTRIFPNKEGKIKYSVKDVNGDILLISQNPLTGNLLNGARIMFNAAKGKDDSYKLFKLLYKKLKLSELNIQHGEFGEHVHATVELDGPSCFYFEKE